MKSLLIQDRTRDKSTRLRFADIVIVFFVLRMISAIASQSLSRLLFYLLINIRGTFFARIVSMQAFSSLNRVQVE